MEISELLDKIYLGIAYDSLRVMGYRAEQVYINIKPRAGYERIVMGPALTTYGEVVKSTDNYEQLDNIRLGLYKREYFSNSPIVILQANDNYCAHSGDITSLIYKNLGAKGFITDGNVRDIDNINAIQFPVFCKDSNPIDAIDYWALTKYNVPVVIENVDIEPNDLIIASRDGVIRVKQNDIQRFYELSSEILNKEEKVRQFLNEHTEQENYSENLQELVNQVGRW